MINERSATWLEEMLKVWQLRDRSPRNFFSFLEDEEEDACHFRNDRKKTWLQTTWALFTSSKLTSRHNFKRIRERKSPQRDSRRTFWSSGGKSSHEVAPGPSPLFKSYMTNVSKLRAPKHHARLWHLLRTSKKYILIHVTHRTGRPMSRPRMPRAECLKPYGRYR